MLYDLYFYSLLKRSFITFLANHFFPPLLIFYTSPSILYYCHRCLYKLFLFIFIHFADKTREVLFERAKYVFVDNEVPHADANAECQKIGGILAKIKSKKLHDVLMKKFDEIIPEDDKRFNTYWIDLKDKIGTAQIFTWGDGETIRVSDGYWAPGEPTDPGTQLCVNIALWRASYGYIGWNDEQCHRSKKVLCQIGDPSFIDIVKLSRNSFLIKLYLKYLSFHKYISYSWSMHLKLQKRWKL